MSQNSHVSGCVFCSEVECARNFKDFLGPISVFGSKDVCNAVDLIVIVLCWIDV